MTRVVKCPICRATVTLEGNPFRPFCSERCKLVDLGRWAGEKYRIPDESAAKRPEDEDEEG
ncbi:MAG: DNA gyrase inhibitor YacG [Candidatus Binatia bacterium]